MVVLKEGAKGAKLTEREQLLLLEIGKDEIYSASSFVDYISEEYAMAKSTVWYNLHKLKSKEMLDFASKEEIGKPMKLTKKGIDGLMRLRSAPAGQYMAVPRSSLYYARTASQSAYALGQN